MSRQLPITVRPVVDEAWVSFLTRTAAANHTSLAAICESAGLLANGRWPSFLGVLVDDRWRNHAAGTLGVQPQQVGAMHLSALDGTAFDLAPLGRAGDFRGAREVAAADWIFLTGSRYCPTCLAEGSAWRLAWRLPWITACTRHRVMLAHRCPHCFADVRSGKGGHASKPTSAYVAARPNACGQAFPSAGRATACSYDLANAPVQSATQAAVDVTETALDIIHQRRGIALGHGRPALDVFRAWRAAAGYVRALSLAGPPEQDYGSARQPPGAASDMTRLQSHALALLESPSVDDGADLLERWCDAAGKRPAPAVFADAFSGVTAITPAVNALLQRSGRSHSLLTRSLDRIDAQTRIALADLEAEDIPQLIWPCALEQSMRTRTKPNSLLLRAVVSLALARIAGACDWGTAATVLGWQASDGRAWSRYVFAAANGELRHTLIATATRLAPRLCRQPVRGAWRQRPSDTGTTTLRRLRSAQQACCRAGEPAVDWCPCTWGTVPETSRGS